MAFFKNRNYLLLGLVSVCVLVAIMVAPRVGRDTPKQRSFDAVKIGVIDAERLKSEAKCFRSHDKVATLVSDLLSEIHKKELQIKNSYETIKKDAKLNIKAKNKELSKIESKWSELSISYNKRMQSIKDLDLKISELVQSKLKDVLDSISRSYKLNIILNKGSKDVTNVFYVSKNMDITNIVIDKMNKVLPEIDLEELK